MPLAAHSACTSCEGPANTARFRCAPSHLEDSPYWRQLGGPQTSARSWQHSSSLSRPSLQGAEGNSDQKKTRQGPGLTKTPRRGLLLLAVLAQSSNLGSHHSEFRLGLGQIEIALGVLLSASSAAAWRHLPFIVQILLPRMAVSDRTVTQLGWNFRMPPATGEISLPSAVSMRTEPGLMRVISGCGGVNAQLAQLHQAKRQNALHLRRWTLRR